MNKKAIVTMMFALAFASCRPTARQAVADAEQLTDSTEAVTSADTPSPRHHRQKHLANRLLYTEDTETSIGLYCRGNDE